MFDIHIHHRADEKKLCEILKTVRVIEHKINNIMATLQDYKNEFARINTATTNIADDIRRLIEKIAAGGMTDAEEAEALTELRAIADQVEAIASTTPEDPVPPTDGTRPR